MELLLEVKAYYIKNIQYFRIHLPKNISNNLQLSKGDTIKAEFIEVIKAQGNIVKLNQTKLSQETS